MTAHNHVPHAGPHAPQGDHAGHEQEHDHDHDHDHAHAHHGGPSPAQALWVAFGLNAAFLVLEAAMGLWTNSLALLSDAGHMVSDVGALGIALFAVRIAVQKPSAAYTFGLRRAPVLGALLNAVSLVAIVVFIGIEAVERFSAPPAQNAGPVLLTGAAGLFINLVSAWYLAKSRDQSVNTRGAMLHLLADALGSVAAIVSGIAVWAWGFTLADPIASLVIGVLILVGSWPLLRDTIALLLQRAPADIDVDGIENALQAADGVHAVHDLHVWGLDDGAPVLSALLLVDDTSLQDTASRADTLRATLKNAFGVQHATLEQRPVASGGPHLGCTDTPTLRDPHAGHNH